MGEKNHTFVQYQTAGDKPHFCTVPDHWGQATFIQYQTAGDKPHFYTVQDQSSYQVEHTLYYESGVLNIEETAAQWLIQIIIKG